MTLFNRLVFICFVVAAFRGCVKRSQSRGEPPDDPKIYGNRPLDDATDHSCERLGRPGETTVFIGMGTLNYCEGKRGLFFTWQPKDPEGEICILEVPTAQRWPKEFPEWAHGRRDEVLANIKRITKARGWNFVFREY